MPQLNKILVVERPNEEPQEYTWDTGSKRRFYFDKYEIESLEAGDVVWRGATAFCLDELKEEPQLEQDRR